MSTITFVHYERYGGRRVYEKQTLLFLSLHTIPFHSKTHSFRPFVRPFVHSPVSYISFLAIMPLLHSSSSSKQPGRYRTRSFHHRHHTTKSTPYYQKSTTILPNRKHRTYQTQTQHYQNQNIDTTLLKTHHPTTTQP